MEITKEEFERYEEVRVGGRTNMFMVSVVCTLSALDKEKVLYIMQHYGDLTKKYPSVRAD